MTRIVMIQVAQINQAVARFNNIRHLRMRTGGFPTVSSLHPEVSDIFPNMERRDKVVTGKPLLYAGHGLMVKSRRQGCMTRKR